MHCVFQYELGFFEIKSLCDRTTAFLKENNTPINYTVLHVLRGTLQKLLPTASQSSAASACSLLPAGFASS